MKTITAVLGFLSLIFASVVSSAVWAGPPPGAAVWPPKGDGKVCYYYTGPNGELGMRACAPGSDPNPGASCKVPDRLVDCCNPEIANFIPVGNVNFRKGVSAPASQVGQTFVVYQCRLKVGVPNDGRAPYIPLPKEFKVVGLKPGEDFYMKNNKSKNFTPLRPFPAGTNPYSPVKAASTTVITSASTSAIAPPVLIETPVDPAISKLRLSGTGPMPNYVLRPISTALNQFSTVDDSSLVRFVGAMAGALRTDGAREAGWVGGPLDYCSAHISSLIAQYRSFRTQADRARPTLEPVMPLQQELLDAVANDLRYSAPGRAIGDQAIAELNGLRDLDIAQSKQPAITDPLYKPVNMSRREVLVRELETRLNRTYQASIATTRTKMQSINPGFDVSATFLFSSPSVPAESESLDVSLVVCTTNASQGFRMCSAKSLINHVKDGDTVDSALSHPVVIRDRGDGFRTSILLPQEPSKPGTPMRPKATEAEHVMADMDTKACILFDASTTVASQRRLPIGNIVYGVGAPATSSSPSGGGTLGGGLPAANSAPPAGNASGIWGPLGDSKEESAGHSAD